MMSMSSFVCHHDARNCVKMHLNLKAPCIYLLLWGVRMKNECAREDDVHATTKPNHHLDLLFILHVGTHQVQEGFSADEDADDAASQEQLRVTAAATAFGPLPRPSLVAPRTKRTTRTRRRTDARSA